jgi:hypothetical protein
MPVTARTAALLLQVVGETTNTVNQTTTDQSSTQSESSFAYLVGSPVDRGKKEERKFSFRLVTFNVKLIIRSHVARCLKPSSFFSLFYFNNVFY